MTSTNLNYLDKAISALKKAGVIVSQPDASPVMAILEKLQRYDNALVLGIASTLQQSSTFNASVREQISGMDIGGRYADIATQFDSIRSDAQQMAEFMDDGKLDWKERIQLQWMRVRRGSIPDRFGVIRASYLEVAHASKDQIERETLILEAYQEFRLALKASEGDAQRLLKLADAEMVKRQAALAEASAAAEDPAQLDGEERSRRELARDVAIRDLQLEDKSYQVAKDLADDLKTSYSTAELVFARIMQSTAVKERLHERAVAFFATNEVVLTGLEASFNSMAGLHEATNTLEQMKAGMNKGLEALAKPGTKALEAGLRAGYGSTLKLDSVQQLANAIVDFQASSIQLVQELRKESTRTAAEIEAATEDGKARFAKLLTKAA